jgi:glycosyltransferase involved in cell wall biosynthesis
MGTDLASSTERPASKSLGRLSVVVLHKGLAPQRAACFTQLAAMPHLDLQVWLTSNANFTSAVHDTRIADLPFTCEVLPGVTVPHGYDGSTSLNPTLLVRLARTRPHVIVSLEMSIPSVTAALYTRVAPCGLVLWAGGTPASEACRNLGRTFLRRLLARSADAVLGYGAASARYWRQIGVPESKIFLPGNPVDVQWWCERAQQAVESRPVRRLELGTGRFTVLSVGQLIPRKRMERILDVARAARDQGLPVDFAIVGSGPALGAMRETISRHKLSNVRLVPAQPVTRLPEFYAAADAFMLASDDIWAFVVLEAMACGLVPIIAPTVGCAEDVIVPGENGFVVDFSRPDDAVTILEQATSDVTGWAGLRARARARALEFTPARWAHVATSAIRHAAASASRRVPNESWARYDGSPKRHPEPSRERRRLVL